MSRMDNDDLDLAMYGSTPIATGIARGVDVESFHWGHGTGTSQGLVVDSSVITTPFDLNGKTIAVPFGSTADYQMQFIIDVFDLDLVRARARERARASARRDPHTLAFHHRPSPPPRPPLYRPSKIWPAARSKPRGRPARSTARSAGGLRTT